MTCDDVRDRLLDFAEGELSSDSLASLQSHLDSCASCAARAVETRKLVGDLGVARSVEQRAYASRSAQSTLADGRRPGALPAKLSILGDFEILDELGRGGMGVVYRARQITLNRVVALKVLLAGGTESERAVDRFLKEAQAAARLHHTNIVPIYGQGHEQGCFYYAMELVDGRSLDKLLSEQRNLHQSVSPRQRSRSWVSSAIQSITHVGGPSVSRDYKTIARQLAEVAEALQHAHDQGIVHRDIKPQNLLLGRDKKLHITDFGLARILDEPGLTRTSEMVGTPAYMAPEQIHSGARVDHRADIYSLGVTLYEMLTLKRPFHAETYDQMIHQVLKREPRPPRKLDPHVPMDLETICLRAMEKEPAARFASAADLARELRRYADDYPITSRRVGPVGKTIRWVKRNPARASALGACVIAVALGAGTWALLNAYANRCIEAARRQLLMVDYDDPRPALAMLNRAPSWAGDRARATVVAAFAIIKKDTDGAIDLLSPYLKQKEGDTDAHYLLAWAFARNANKGDNSLWSRAQAELDLGDLCHLTRPTSAAGLFFKGQALGYFDPVDAYRVLDAAVNSDAGPQGLMHQGRVANIILAVLRDRSYWLRGKGRLEMACDLRRNKAYPRYLLSIGHRLAGMHYRDFPQSDSARMDQQDAFAESLRLAKEAQSVEPDDARGYVAEAEYWEEFGNWDAALRAREQMETETQSAPEKRQYFDFRGERWAYPMRIYFWAGRYDKADEARANRYPPSKSYDVDEAFYGAIIARSAGNERAARDALEAGVQRVGIHAEDRLKLDAAYRICGFASPDGFLVGELDYNDRRSARWTRAWLQAVARYYRDEISFEQLKSEIELQYPTNQCDQSRARTASEFYRGVKALAGGQFDDASKALLLAWKQNDFENYCFRAKFLQMKMSADPNWPAWLARSDSAPSK